MDATYLGELRALNETNFARFDAKLEQRVAELRGEVKAGIAGMRADVLKWIVGLWLVTMLGIASLFAQIAGLR